MREIFRDEEIMAEFQGGQFEFQGQASVSLIAAGGGANLGCKLAVMIISRTKKNSLIAELAAIVSRYNDRSWQK